MAGVVMLFHSAMSRMNRTLPDAVEGESDPKTSSWRDHHGTMTRANSPTHAAAAPNPMAGRRSRRSPGPPAIPGEGQAKRNQDEQAVVAGQRREPGEEACPRECATGALEAAGAEPERANDERLVEREVVRLDQVHRREEREGDEHAGADRNQRARTRVARDGPRQRGRQRADQRERCRGRPCDVPEHGQEWHLDHGRERHPVSVRRDRQRRVGRDDAADLGEDPDEVDVEALPRLEGARDIDVIGRIGVRRLREVPDEHRPNGEGEPVQQ